MRPPTDDEPIRLNFEAPEAAVAEFPGFAFFEIQLRLPVNGRWVLVVTGGTGAISLPVLVSDMPATIGFDAPVLSDDPRGFAERLSRAPAASLQRSWVRLTVLTPNPAVGSAA